MAKTNNFVKHVSTEYFFSDQSVVVYDISLKKKGPEEDKIFASDIVKHYPYLRISTIMLGED